MNRYWVLWGSGAAEGGAWFEETRHWELVLGLHLALAPVCSTLLPDGLAVRHSLAPSLPEWTKTSETVS